MSYDMKKIDWNNWKFWNEYGEGHKQDVKLGKISKSDLVYNLYKEHMDKELPEKPRTFTEIINHMKLDPKINRTYYKYIDKYKVRSYVKKTIGEKYLIPCFWKKEKIYLEDLEKLPNGFVLKTNNGSGTNHIVMNKANEDLNEVCDYMNFLATIDFAYLHGEYAYEKIKPQIIAEKLILDSKGAIPDDLKCFCFKDKDGIRRKILYIERVVGDERYRVFLDENWETLDINCNFEKLDIDLKRPVNYQEILSVIDKLSAPFPFVRVDLYVVDKQIYFGELTFTPTAGYMKFTDDTDSVWGTYIGYKKHWI